MKGWWIPGVLLIVAGCNKPNPAFEEGDGSEATGDGDPIPGDGDGDPTPGDGDPTPGDGDGDPTPGDGDGDPTGDGDGDPTGDGDGDPGCLGEEPDECGDICTNVITDPDNCGMCGNACDDACIVGHCERKRIIFATKTLYTGDLDGIQGADFRCSFDGAAYYPEKFFLAWNSSPQVYPNNTIAQDGYFVRTDETMVAQSWQDLTDGELAVPIEFDESGALIPGDEPCALGSQAWTGTTAGGDHFQGPNCFDWMTASEGYDGTYGNVHATNASWSVADLDCFDPPLCNQQRRIYCIEV